MYYLIRLYHNEANLSFDKKEHYKNAGETEKMNGEMTNAGDKLNFVYLLIFINSRKYYYPKERKMQIWMSDQQKE